jgi:hypothetical protein
VLRHRPCQAADVAEAEAIDLSNEDGKRGKIVFPDEFWRIVHPIHIDHEGDIPKDNVPCAVTHTELTGPFLFAEKQ